MNRFFAVSVLMVLGMAASCMGQAKVSFKCISIVKCLIFITIDVISLGVEFLPSKATTVDDVWGERDLVMHATVNDESRILLE